MQHINNKSLLNKNIKDQNTLQLIVQEKKNKLTLTNNREIAIGGDPQQSFSIMYLYE
jgi:hypothetical protein